MMSDSKTSDRIFDALNVVPEDGCSRLKAVDEAVASGSSVNCFDSDGLTPLMISASHGDFECVQLLLEAGADVNEVGADNQTALIECLTDEPDMQVTPTARFKCLSLLLQAGAEVYKANRFCITPLMAAAYICDALCLKEILDKGYKTTNNGVARILSTTDDVEQTGCHGTFGIPHSSKNQDLFVTTNAGNLSESDKSTNSSNSDTVADADDADDAIVDDINAVDDIECRNALHHCLYSDNNGEDQLKCLKLLIEAGADANIPEWKTSSLSIAISSASNSLDLVRCLLSAGASFDPCKDFEHAVVSRNVELVKEFVKMGGDVHYLNSHTYTPLLGLISNIDRSHKRIQELDERTKACSKILVEAGSDINVRSHHDLQPIHFALLLWPFLKFPAEYLISENCDLCNVTLTKVKSVWYIDFRDHFTADYVLNMVKFLFQCGLSTYLCRSFIENDEAIRRWVDCEASQPRRLGSLCVLRIRNILGLHIKSKVKQLNVPGVVEGCILLKHALDEDCF